MNSYKIQPYLSQLEKLWDSVTVEVTSEKTGIILLKEFQKSTGRFITFKLTAWSINDMILSFSAGRIPFQDCEQFRFLQETYKILEEFFPKNNFISPGEQPAKDVELYGVDQIKGILKEMDENSPMYTIPLKGDISTDDIVNRLVEKKAAKEESRAIGEKTRKILAERKSLETVYVDRKKEQEIFLADLRNGVVRYESWCKYRQRHNINPESPIDHVIQAHINTFEEIWGEALESYGKERMELHEFNQGKLELKKELSEYESKKNPHPLDLTGMEVGETHPLDELKELTNF